MERFESDMETVLCEDRDAIPRMVAARAAVEAEVVRCLSELARAHLFVYDLKPSNMVVRFRDDGGADVRVIDFAATFASASCRTPRQASPHRHAAAAHREEDGCADGSRALDERVSHVLFVVMMVILSCTTTRCLYEDRGHHRLDREDAKTSTRCAAAFASCSTRSATATWRSCARSSAWTRSAASSATTTAAATRGPGAPCGSPSAWRTGARERSACKDAEKRCTGVFFPRTPCKKKHADDLLSRRPPLGVRRGAAPLRHDGRDCGRG